MTNSVLFVTMDQWRGDCLSALGHPVVKTPALDRLAAQGVLFANHWANTAPCGPSRASLYTGTYLHHHRSVQNGTPLDDRLTNVARLATLAGYRPVLFGYTDTSIDPRVVPAGDRRLFTYEGVLPGFLPQLVDRWEDGSPAWGKWLAARGVDVPANPHDLYLPAEGYPGAAGHASTWAPARFPAELSQTAFVAEAVMGWLERHGDQPFFLHASFIRPHPPRRNPPGYHDRYSAEQVGPFAGAPRREEEMALHPFNQVMALPGVAAPDDEQERRQIRATYYGALAEVDDQLGRLFSFLETQGLSDRTLVVVTSDHGEMGGDHWLLEKLGYWDESYRVPLIICRPDQQTPSSRGLVVNDFTESVDVLPTMCEWMGVEVPPQVDGWSLGPFLDSGRPPAHWRRSAHFEWDFSRPAMETSIPMSHRWLAVQRGADHKYVQFAGDPAAFPPLVFDLKDDPGQLHNLAGQPGSAELGWRCAQELLQWRMRNEDRELSGHFLSPSEGLVVTRDPWR